MAAVLNKSEVAQEEKKLVTYFKFYAKQKVADLHFPLFTYDYYLT